MLVMPSGGGGVGWWEVELPKSFFFLFAVANFLFVHKNRRLGELFRDADPERAKPLQSLVCV